MPSAYGWLIIAEIILGALAVAVLGLAGVLTSLTALALVVGANLIAPGATYTPFGLAVRRGPIP